MIRIAIDRGKCIGCLTCTTACVVAHEGKDTRNHISINDKGRFTPIFCRMCSKPECVYTCMSGAMRKDDETGLVLYDESRCAHCFMCIRACPYSVLKMDKYTDSIVMKCDYCRSTKYDGPQCTANCPTGAITLQEVSEQ